MKDYTDYDNRYDAARLAFLRSFVPAGPGRAAEVGCASGVTTQMVSDFGWKVVGFDLDPVVIARARDLHRDLRFKVGSAADLPREQDLVVCLEVLEHVAPVDQPSFMQDLRAALCPGGLLLISTPGRYSLVATYERLRGWRHRSDAYDWWDPTHVGVVSVRTLRRRLAEAGFRVERMGGFHLVPERLSPPRGSEHRLARRLAFNIVVLARAVAEPG